jgi:hypothetical protein
VSNTNSDNEIGVRPTGGVGGLTRDTGLNLGAGDDDAEERDCDAGIRSGWRSIKR